MEASAFIHQDGKTDAGGVSDLVAWWSFTKTALAIALLRLSERGKVSLGEPIEGEPPIPPFNSCGMKQGYRTTALFRATMRMLKRGARLGPPMIC